MNNTLDEDNLQMLSSIAISKLFPELCSEYRALKQDIRDIFGRELSNRQSVVFREISGKEGSLRNVLREAVVEDVVSLFPYVILSVFGAIQCSSVYFCSSIDRPRLSSCASTHDELNASEVAASKKSHVAHTSTRLYDALRSGVTVSWLSTDMSKACPGC
jgi:hypothetical protein